MNKNFNSNALVYLILFSLLGSDLIFSWLYKFDFPVGLLRNLRDLFIIAIGLLSVFFYIYRSISKDYFFIPLALLSCTLIPFLFALTEFLSFSAFQSIKGALVFVLPTGLIFSSFYICKYFKARTLYKALLYFGVASSVFSFYEIRNTDFWLEVVNLPRYLSDVKGIHWSSFEYFYNLPHNFFRDYSSTLRRGAGLITSPLAQGNLLAAAFILNLEIGLVRKITRNIFSIILAIGVIISGTRLALIYIFAYFFIKIFINIKNTLTTNTRIKISIKIVPFTLMPIFIIIYFFRSSYFLNLIDASSEFHLFAFFSNLNLLREMPFWGYGLGSQSRYSDSYTQGMIGFGEGSFFSLSFQFGYLGLLAFLGFIFSFINYFLKISFYKVNYSSKESVLGIACVIGTFLMSFFNELYTSFTGFLPIAILIGGSLESLQNIRNFSKGTNIEMN